MASNIPTRRIVRAVKAPQSDENKTAKPTATTARLTGLKKAGLGSAESSTTSTTTATKARTATGTGAGLGLAGADAGAKRKREALGEVTNGKGKPSGLKGKKAVDDKDLKATAAPVRGLVRKPRADALRERGSSVDAGSVSGGETSAATRAIVTTSTTQVLARRTVTTKKSYVYGDDEASASTSAAPAEEEAEQPVHKRRRTSPIPTSEDSRAEPRSTEDVHLEVIQEEEAQMEADATAVIVVAEGLDVAGWQDLDREDDDDPSMVSEYVNDIFNYFRQIEINTLPDASYMDHQKELKWAHRDILVDFIIQLHGRYHLQQESLFLAINIMDRFMSRREVSMERYQLVGCVAFFIATKTEETIAPSVKHIVEFCEKQYTEEEIFKAERYMLTAIEWDMSYPNPLNFLRRASKADDYDVVRRTLAKYFCEIGIVEHRLVACPPSLLAAAAMWLARITQDMYEWTANLEHYSGYSERQIVPVAEILISFLQRPVEHEYFHKKYGSKKYYKASVWTRWWVSQLWSKKETVDLTANLPKLKQILAARNKFRKEQAEAAARAAGEVQEEEQ